MKFRYVLTLFFIVLLAIFVRFVNLGSTPQGFTVDEASIGYDAYSILKTGKDQWNNFFPTSFKSLGDNKNPIYIYLTTIPVAAFGLSEFSTRFVSALSGILTVILLYFFALEIFKEKKIGLLSSFLFAVSPWSIFISRTALEANLGVFFSTFGFLFLFKFINHQRNRYAIYTILLFLAASFSYHSPRIFIPALLIPVLIIYKDKLLFNNKQKLISISIFALSLTPLILTIFSANTRFGQINATRTIGINNQINEDRGACLQNFVAPLCKISFNKPLVYSVDFIKNYLMHYSIETLFIKGPPLSGYALGNYGLLYLIEMPFFLLSMIYFLFKREKPHLFLLAWLLIYPLGSALTGGNNPARMIVMLPAAQIIIAFGIYKCLSLFQKERQTITAAIIIFLISMSLGKYLINYFYVYPTFSSKILQYGYKPLFAELSLREAKYSQIIISRKSDDAKQYIFLLFYNKIDPKLFQSQKDIELSYQDGGWIWVDKFGKYRFLKSIPPELPVKSLLVAAPDEFPKEVEKEFTVPDLKGDIIFIGVDSDKLIKLIEEKKKYEKI